jgi:murein DD-endopeptidase MepM/ murein hydrolase activator NlpD
MSARPLRRHLKRRRGVLAVAGLALAIAATPAAGDVYSRKHSVDARISTLHARIAAAQQRAQGLSAEIDRVNSRIHGLEARVGDVSAQLATLEEDLALHQRKLDRLTALFRLETKRYLYLRHEYGFALGRLNARLVEVYERGDVEALDVLLEASSFTELLDGLDYVNEVGAEDERIATSVGDAKVAAKKARERTRKVRGVVAAETRAVAGRTEQARALRDELVANRQSLVAARSHKRISLAKVKASEREEVSEAEALERVSASLGAQIQAAQSSSASAYSAPVHQSSSGFIWPVNGPVVSGFGVRWGRMHTGIDIAVAYGTPIHAAAAGRVIYAGWMDGYGNLVFVDHGGGISTGYAHQSSIAVSNGQTVSQGQLIGYVGCTGHCFGPHLHFEVRVNGSPVDPLGYL